jgi:hypothetical protein
MPPELTVVLVVGERRERAAAALASVLAQDGAAIEVVVCDCAPHAPPLPSGVAGTSGLSAVSVGFADPGAGGGAEAAGAGHPAVRRVALPPGTTYAAAKALGVRLAAAPVVAFLEEHCRVYAGWAAALVAAHRGPWAGVGAEVHNANPGVARSRTVALMNYHPWLAPAPRREHDMLPGHNSSFKRGVLLAYGDRLEALLRAEIALHTRLVRDGHRLLLEPAARFEHLNDSRLASVLHSCFLFHRCYGPSRAEALGWSARRRAAYVAATPLVPLYFLARLLLVLARRRPRLLPAALGGAPFMLLVQAASAAGQAAGLLRGLGDAELRFTRYELNAYRTPDGGRDEDPAGWREARS